MPDDSNLYERGGTFYARIQINGRDVRRSLRTTDRRIARQRLKALLAQAEERRAGIAPPPAPHPWEEAVAAWADLELAGLRPATQDRYRTSLKQLHPHFHGRAVEALTAADVHAYTLARARQGVKPATVRRDLMVMGRVLRVAKRAGWITANPVPEEMGEISEKREPIRPVPLRQVARLIQIAPPGLAAMARFLARTGCRQEEAASLEWTQVDLTRHRVTFTRTKTRNPRVIEITAQVARDLSRLPRDRTSPYVFRSREGDRFLQVRGRFRELVTRIMGRTSQAAGRAGRGVPRPFRCHDLRHTFAIRALQRGISIYALARHLGHTTVKTTEMYSGWLTRPPE